MPSSLAIRADASPQRGLGHLVRMGRLADALTARGHGVRFLTDAGSLGERLLREQGRDIAIMDGADDFATLTRVTATVDLTVFDVLDTRDDEIDAVSTGHMVCFDDCGAGLRRAAAVINPIVFSWNRYLPGCRQGLFEGPDYMILPPRLVAARPMVAAKAHRLLMAFGGTDTHGLSGRMLTLLGALPRSLHVRLNLGPGAVPSPTLEQAVRTSLHRVDILRGVPDLVAEMVRADLVICGGGIMLYELTAMGVPCAALATEDHEVLNIAWFAGQGCIADLGNHAVLTADILAKRVTPLLDDGAVRRRLSDTGKATVDGQGLSRVVTIIEDLLS